MSFILNINDKSEKGFRHPFIFELIFAIHNIEGYCKMKEIEPLDMHNLRLFERLFWNKGKYLAHPKRFGDKVEYLFWFSKTKERKFNIDSMRLKYDEKSVKYYCLIFRSIITFLYIFVIQCYGRKVFYEL